MLKDFVVVAAPGLDSAPRFVPGLEPLQAQSFVSKTPVEAFVSAVLPRLAGVAEQNLDVLFVDPELDRIADDLRAVVGAHLSRRAMIAYQLAQDVDQAVAPDAPRHDDGLVIAGELVDDGQIYNLLYFGAGVEYEAIGPDAVRACGP